MRKSQAFPRSQSFYDDDDKDIIRIASSKGIDTNAWKNDTHCKICGEGFLQNAMRKHYCNFCFRGVCDDCSDNSGRYPGKSGEYRCCSDCYFDQQKGNSASAKIQELADNLDLQVQQAALQKQEEMSKSQTIQENIESIKELIKISNSEKIPHIKELVEINYQLEEEKSELKEKLEAQRGEHQSIHQQLLQIQVEYLKLDKKLKEVQGQMKQEKELAAKYQSQLGNVNNYQGSKSFEITDYGKLITHKEHEISEAQEKLSKLRSIQNKRLNELKHTIQELENQIQQNNGGRNGTNHAETLQNLRIENESLNSKLRDLEHEQNAQRAELFEALESVKIQLEMEQEIHANLNPKDPASLHYSALYFDTKRRNEELQRKIQDRIIENEQIKQRILAGPPEHFQRGEEAPEIIGRNRCKCALF